MESLLSFWRGRTTGQKVAIVVLGIVAIVAISGMGRGGLPNNSIAPPPAAERARDFAQQHGGDPAVYEAIFLETQCSAVEAAFNDASEDNAAAASGTPEHEISRGRMLAASARLREVGC
jgi:hypothetical protein